MRFKIATLILSGLAPFVASLWPPLYVVLVSYYAFSYPATVLYGLMWLGLFAALYLRTGPRDRPKLRYLLVFALFAFTLPAHLILMGIGVPPFLPEYFSPM